MSRPLHAKVLFIAYYFPPTGGGGVQRSSKFVKNLPGYGWQPLVLTVREPYDFYMDPQLMADIPPEALVFRTFSIEPMKWVRKLVKYLWRMRLARRGAQQSPRKTEAKSLKPGFLVTLKTYLLVPDNEILWLPFAVWRGWRVIRRHRPQIIYSTASPYTDHLIGLLLARISGIPWVADFRDPWVDRGNFPQNRWRLFIDRKMERWVLKHAAQIVATTDLINENYRKMVPQQRYATITNGYDEDDFRGKERPLPADAFVITYTGIFNRERSPRKFLEALAALVARRADFRDMVRVRLIGQLDNPGDFHNHGMIEELGLSDYVQGEPYRPHKESIAALQESTILFLMLGEYPGNAAFIPGKLFEYLRAGRPIFAMVSPAGAAAAIIRQTASGLVVPNDDRQAVEKGLESMFDRFLEGKLAETYPGKNIQQYERARLTGRLVKLFDMLLAAPTLPQEKSKGDQ